MVTVTSDFALAVITAITAGASDVYAVASVVDIPHASATLRATISSLATAGLIDVTSGVDGAVTLTPA